MLALDISRFIAALTVWMEARGEGEDGMIAVAWALANRHAAGKWFSGKTLAETCLMKFAFSCWNTLDPNRLAMSRMVGDEQIFVDIDGYLGDAVSGIGEDPTFGATHYIDKSISPPPWATQATKTVTIGRLTFYKNVN